MKLRHTLLALAFASVALPASAQQFTNTVFFGDSLTDSGTFRPALIQQAGPGAAAVGRFTTNPYLVWSEQLAKMYGYDITPSNVGGTNYAVGGARAGVDVAGPFGAIPSVSKQVSTYLAANGGRADPNALYSVWAGGNDILAVLGGAPAQATIGAAVTAEVGAIAALKNAGAQYILMPILPDLGLTPTAIAGGAAGVAGATQASIAYNQALLSGLTSLGINVIPVDTFSLLREVKANAAAFGYTNTTGTACGAVSSLTCSPANYVAPNASETYLFADGVHPTGKTHTIMAQLAYSMVAAPYQIAMVSKSSLNAGSSRAERVFGASNTRPKDGGGATWWADVRGNYQRFDHGNQFDGHGLGLLVGGTFGSGSVTYGPFLGYGKQNNDFGNSSGSFDQSEATVGGFVRWQGQGPWAALQASYSKTSADVERQIVLGPVVREHRGSLDGNTVTVGAQGGFDFTSGHLKHGPYLSVVSQRADLDGYTESDPTLSTALSYGDLKMDSLQGTAGWKFELTSDSGLAPYASIGYRKEFEDKPADIWATSMTTGMSYRVPGPQFDQDYGVLNVGAKTKLFGLATDVGVSASLGEKDTQQATVYVTVSF